MLCSPHLENPACYVSTFPCVPTLHPSTSRHTFCLPLLACMHLSRSACCLKVPSTLRHCCCNFALPCFPCGTRFCCPYPANIGCLTQGAPSLSKLGAPFPSIGTYSMVPIHFPCIPLPCLALTCPSLTHD